MFGPAGKGCGQMDFTGVRSVTFEYADLADLLARKTHNPLAEEFIPELLRQGSEPGSLFS
jgi:hypothetical protein